MKGEGWQNRRERYLDKFPRRLPDIIETHIVTADEKRQISCFTTR